jgi:hypothetical protein
VLAWEKGETFGNVDAYAKLALELDGENMSQNRRSFLRRAFAFTVVVVAAPTALVAPQTWRKVKDWHNDFLNAGRLNEAQAERFVQYLLDDTVLRATEEGFDADKGAK